MGAPREGCAKPLDAACGMHSTMHCERWKFQPSKSRMTPPILYSANPWYATEVAEKYRSGLHFAWLSEYFDSEKDAPAGSAGRLIAPSSNPRKIYEDLWHEYDAQEEHSRIIKAHKKTFRRLAKAWLGSGEISQDQHDEIYASVNSRSWKIWKPVLYVIPRRSIDESRIIPIGRRDRAGYGPEYQIHDLKRDEFDIVDFTSCWRL